MNIVVDTNILFSAIIKDGLIREKLLDLNNNYLIPEFLFEEIYNHKKELIKKAKLFEKELDTLLLRLTKYIRIVPTEMIIKYKKEANKIMRNIDPNDSIFIATALSFNCPVWSDDRHLKKQKRIKVYNTKEFIKIT